MHQFIKFSLLVGLFFLAKGLNFCQASLGQEVTVSGIIAIVNEEEVKLRVPSGMLILPRKFVPKGFAALPGRVLTLELPLDKVQKIKVMAN